MSTEFAALGLSPATLSALGRAGYVTPTPIQAKTIPPGLAGRDVIGCAATGTGKTAAFVLPIVERLGKDKNKRGVRALVLAPTRELALQIEEHARNFGAPHNVKSVAVIGGVGMGPQKDGLSYAALCIATPGRLIDHLNEGNVTLANVEILVLDEADRMLDMGFKPQLTRILAKLPKQRQTLLFSATMAGEVAEFAKHSSHDPVRVEVSRSGATAERATQCVFDVGQNDKTPLLLSLLARGEESTLVFTRTKRRADKLTKALTRAGHSVERIHADRSQNQRKHALDGFKSGKYRVLVATDIAARGIDVADIGHVVNYDLPHVPEDYVHRVGRTARASASGHASAFCAPDEVPLLRDIEKLVRDRIPREKLPVDDAVFKEAVAAERARQSDPGPKQHGHGVSTRPAGAQPGRHARSHQKKHHGGGGGGGGGAKPAGSKPQTVFSGSPRRR
ncbi:MAG: DEAD/DEAH box helicase [Archangium sp.]